MDPSSNPTTSQPNENEDQLPDIRICENGHEHEVFEGQFYERRYANWRTNIKMSEKLNICRKYYIAGFFLLPLFWLVNFIWHYNDAYHAEPFEEQPQFRRYVLRSGIGFIAWTVVLLGWVICFQTQRYYNDWDYLTFNFPTGSA